LSAREKYLSDYLSDIFGIPASPVVLDPTLLLPAQEYRTIMNTNSGAKMKPYVFCYCVLEDDKMVSLATELARVSTGRTIYVLDEPTTGLHAADVHKLIDVLQKLVDMGNTVLVIEHNLDVIKTADYIIDLGPDGGDGGGLLVACGTPEAVAAVEGSYTGQYLKRYLK
jgi:hypothetical protein